jgi:hypothetical protein
MESAMAKARKKSTTLKATADELAGLQHGFDFISWQTFVAQNLPAVRQLTVDDKKVAIVRVGKTKYGLRKGWGRNEFVQFALQMVCEGYPPRDNNITQLTKDVNKFLDDYPEYRRARLGKITRRMVQRVLDQMRVLGRMRP